MLRGDPVALRSDTCTGDIAFQEALACMVAGRCSEIVSTFI